MDNELLSDYFEQEMESLEMPPGLATNVILAIEAGQKVKEARILTMSIAAIAMIAIALSVKYFSLEAVIGAMVLGLFAWFFTAAEIKQKQAIYA